MNDEIDIVILHDATSDDGSDRNFGVTFFCKYNSLACEMESPSADRNT